jgi:phosphoribosylglycinamide formyltransferase-1
VRIAVFASGRGSNFSAISRAIKKGKLKASLVLLVCDRPQAKVLSKAKRQGIRIALVKRGDFPSRDAFEEKILEHLKKENIELIVLAGYMRILGPRLVAAYQNKILNIHPSLLPAFKGATGIKDAFDYGVKVTGVTVHLVDKELDHGPIILQAAVRIAEDDTPQSLEKKIHHLEHRLYPEAIALYLAGRLKIEGRTLRLSC